MKAKLTKLFTLLAAVGLASSAWATVASGTKVISYSGQTLPQYTTDDATIYDYIYGAFKEGGTLELALTLNYDSSTSCSDYQCIFHAGAKDTGFSLYQNGSTSLLFSPKNQTESTYEQGSVLNNGANTLVFRFVGCGNDQAAVSITVNGSRKERGAWKFSDMSWSSTASECNKYCMGCQAPGWTQKPLVNSTISDNTITATYTAAPSMRYHNRLATDDVTIPSDTYGQIEVPANGFCATALTGRTTLSSTASGDEISGDYSGIISNDGANNWDIRAHTFAGWFKIDTLPTSTGAANAKTIYVVRNTNSSNAGYKVAVDSTGELIINKCDNEAWNDDGGSAVTTTGASIQAGTWFHLAVAVSGRTDSNRKSSAIVYINGATVTTSDTKFKTNMATGSSTIYIGDKDVSSGLGISAAGIYVDNGTLIAADNVINVATNSAYVKGKVVASTHAATISEDKDWTALDWNPSWPSGGSSGAIATVTNTATMATLTINETETMNTLAVVSEEGKNLTLEKNDVTVMVETCEFSAATGTTTVAFSTGAATVYAGADTVLTADGTTGGAIIVNSGKKATVPAWYFDHRTLNDGGYLKFTGDIGTQLLATDGGIPRQGATVEIAGAATIAGDSSFASGSANTKIIVSGAVTTAVNNAEIKLANNANSIFEVAGGELVLQDRVRIQQDTTGKLILSGGEIKATSTGFLYPGGGYAGGSMDFTITGGKFTAPYNPYNQKMGCNAKVNISGGIFAPENLYTTGDGNKPTTDDTATSRSGSGFAVNMTGGTFEMPSGVPNWLPVNVTSGTAVLSVQDDVTTAYNYGLLTVSSGATAQIDPGAGKAIRATGGIANSGTIDLRSGTLLVDKGSTTLGTVTLNGGVLDLNGWGVSGVTFTGSGVVTNSSTNAGSVNGVQVAQDEALTVTNGKITITLGDDDVLTLTSIPAAGQVEIAGSGRVEYESTTIPMLPSGLWASNWTGTFAWSGFNSTVGPWNIGGANYYNGTSSKFEFNGTVTGGYLGGTATLGELVLNGSITLNAGSDSRTYTIAKLSGNGALHYTATGDQARPHFAFVDIDSFTGTLDAGTKGRFVVGSDNTENTNAGIILVKGSNGVVLAADSLVAGTCVRIANGAGLTINKPDFTTSALQVNGGTLNLSRVDASSAWCTAGTTTFASGSKVIIPPMAAVEAGTYTVLGSGAGNTFTTENITFKNGNTELTGHSVAVSGTTATLTTTSSTRMYFNRLSGSEIIPADTYGAITMTRRMLATTCESETKLENSASDPERGGTYTDIIKKIKYSTEDTDTETHTFAGWFKIGTLPTGDATKTIYWARSQGTGSDHNGYMVAVTSTGAIKVGKTSKLAFADGLVSTDTPIKAGEWFHLAVAVTKSASSGTTNVRTATPTVFVNGVQVAMPSGTFATNLAGNNCSDLLIGAGVTAAGIFVDTTAITDVAMIKKIAVSSKYLKPVVFTATAMTGNFSAQTWSPTPEAGDYALGYSWQINNTTADTTVTFDTAVTADTLTLNATAAMTLEIGDGSLTATTVDDSASTAATTFNFSAGAANVIAGADTVLTAAGTTGGAITVNSGKKATVPAWYWEHRSVLSGGHLKVTGSLGEKTLAYTTDNSGLTINGATVEIAGSATIYGTFASGTANTKIISSGTVVTKSGNNEVIIVNDQYSTFEVAGGTFTLQGRVMPGQNNKNTTFNITGGEMTSTGNGFWYPGGGYDNGSSALNISGGKFSALYGPYKGTKDCIAGHTANINVSGTGVFAPAKIWYSTDGNVPTSDNTATEVANSKHKVNMTGGTYEMPASVPNWLPVNVNDDATIGVQTGVAAVENRAPIVLAAGTTLTLTTDVAFVQTGNISAGSDASFVKTGSGSLTIGQAAGFSGSVTINGGNLTATTNMLGGAITVATGATLTIDLAELQTAAQTSSGKVFNFQGELADGQLILLNQDKYPWISIGTSGDNLGKIIIDDTQKPTGLHIVRMLPKTTSKTADRDVNGRDSGWIELCNYGPTVTNLANYKIVRANLGKEFKDSGKKAIDKLLNYELAVGETIRVYTSEEYETAEDYGGKGLEVAWFKKVDNVVTKLDAYEDGAIMVIPTKVNPKKYPMVRLYDSTGKTVYDEVVVPCDIDDNIMVELTHLKDKLVRSVVYPDGSKVEYGPDINSMYGIKNVIGDLALMKPNGFAPAGAAYPVTFPVNPFKTGSTVLEDNEIDNVKLVYRVFDPTTISVSNTVAMTLRTEPMTEAETNTYGTGCALWDGSIPSEAMATAGKLVQFRAEITDKGGKTWYAPRNLNPDIGYEWYGVVVQPTIAETVPSDNLASTSVCTNRLDTFLMFVDDTNKAQMDWDVDKQTLPNKARIAIYDASTHTYYDNVRIDLRGQTSSDFLKKSHGLRFSKVAPLTCVDPFTHETNTLRKTSFIAEYADPMFIRQTMSLRVMRESGVKAPFDYPVRLYLNGTFYQLAFHSSRFTDEAVEDLYGLNKYGYSYKNVHQLNTSSGAEKKTPDDDNESDLTVLNQYAARIENETDSTTLTKIAMTNFNIAAWVNYLAAARVTQEMDDVWTNLGIYINKYDSFFNENGDDTMMPLAYDQNLSLGIWHFGDDRDRSKNGIIANNDNMKSHPFYGGRLLPYIKADNTTKIDQPNRGMEVILQNATFREMLVRRLRTNMDTFLGEPGTPKEQTKLWQWVVAYTNAISGDVAADHAKWEYSKIGENVSHAQNIWIWDSGSNAPTFEQAVEELWTGYIVPRRTHLYCTHSTTNSEKAVGYARDLSAGIPFAQAETATFGKHGALYFTDINGKRPGEDGFNLNVEDGIIGICNTNTVAIDMSNWKVTGAVEATLKPGTVIPANGTLWIVENRQTAANAIIANSGVAKPVIVNLDKTLLDAEDEREEYFDFDVNRIQLKDADGTKAISYEAKIGDDKYITVEEALNVSTSGEEIKLLVDIDTASPLTVKTGVDFDCNEFMLKVDTFTLSDGSKFKADTGTNLTVRTTFTLGDDVDFRIKTATTNGAVIATVPVLFDATDKAVKVYGATGYGLKNTAGVLSLVKTTPTVVFDEIVDEPLTNFNGSVVLAKYKVLDAGDGTSYTLGATITIDGKDYTGEIDKENRTITFTLPSSVVGAGKVYTGVVTVTSKQGEAEAVVQDASKGVIYQGAKQDEPEVLDTWINESVATFKTTGTWTPEPTTNATDIIITEDAANVFTPTTAQQGQKVVLDANVSFDAPDDVETDIEDLQGGIRVVTDAEDDEVYRFAMILDGAWFTNTTVAASLNTSYTIRTTIDYHTSKSTLTYALVDGDTSTTLGEGTTGSLSSSVANIEFTGAGLVKSFKGTDYIDQVDASLVEDGDGKKYADIDKATAAGKTDLKLLWNTAWNPDATKDGDWTISCDGYKFYVDSKDGVHIAKDGDTYRIISNYYEVMQYLADGSATNKVMYFVNAFGQNNATNVLLRDVTLTNLFAIANSVTLDGQTHEIVGGTDKGLSIGANVTLKITGGYINTAITTNDTKSALVLEGGKYTEAGTNAFVNCVADGYHFAPLAKLDKYEEYVAQVIKGEEPLDPSDEVVFPVGKAEDAKQGDVATNYVGEVAFSKEWLVDKKVVDDVEDINTNATAVAQKLNTVEKNKIAAWENLVLGLDGAAAENIPVIQPVQATETDKITFKLGGVDVDTDSGVKVEYKVWSGATPGAKTESTATATHDAETKVTLPTSGVKYYTIEVITTPAK